MYQCMLSTQELVGIHNNSAHKSWSKHTTDVKVGKVNYKINATENVNAKLSWIQINISIPCKRNMNEIYLVYKGMLDPIIIS